MGAAASPVPASASAALLALALGAKELLELCWGHPGALDPRTCGFIVLLVAALMVHTLYSTHRQRHLMPTLDHSLAGLCEMQPDDAQKRGSKQHGEQKGEDEPDEEPRAYDRDGDALAGANEEACQEDALNQASERHDEQKGDDEPLAEPRTYEHDEEGQAGVDEDEDDESGTHKVATRRMRLQEEGRQRRWRRQQKEPHMQCEQNESSAKPQEQSEPSTPPRIGVDIGGVLNRHNNDVAGDTSRWHLSPDSEAPGAMASLKSVIEQFGPDNVFLVSKVGPGMEARTETWLHDTMDICSRTGLLRENIHFCRGSTGAQGKGPLAKELGLSHFVDDKDENLWSVHSDPAGNARGAIERHHGQLFHFARSGVGQSPPRPHKWKRRPVCVIPVANWRDLLERLRTADGI